MTTTEIICCLQELRKNAVIDGCVSPKITIIHDVKPDSFDWVISEAIQALEKSILFEDKTCTTKKYFGETTATNKSDFDDIWDF